MQKRLGIYVEPQFQNLDRKYRKLQAQPEHQESEWSRGI